MLIKRLVKLSLLGVSVIVASHLNQAQAKIVEVKDFVNTFSQEAWTIKLDSPAKSAPKISFDKSRNNIVVTFPNDYVDTNSIRSGYKITNSIFDHINFAGSSRGQNQVVFHVGQAGLNTYSIVPDDNNSYRVNVSFASKATFKPLKVAVDPGHGGKDPGTIGKVYGTYEKDVTFGIANELLLLLNKDKNFNFYLTRNGNYYIPVTDRPKLAAEAQADIFVSIHADASPNDRAIGASVYVINEDRKNRELRSLIHNPGNAPLKSGSELAKLIRSNNDSAADLSDITFTHTKAQALDLAKTVLAKLKTFANLSRSTPVEKSLGAIKAPEIPSILVETGYLSNKYEESKLRTAAYQQEIANAIYEALKDYRQKNLSFFQTSTNVGDIVMMPDKGGFIAKQRVTDNSSGTVVSGANTYTVQNGDSWYKIAADHDVDIKQLLEVNEGKTLNSPLSAGQVVNIPVLKEAALTEVAAKVDNGKTIAYRIKPGDQLQQIASGHSISVQQLLAANPSLSDPSKIIVGQVIHIPVGEKEPDNDSVAVTKVVDSGDVYRVQAGDSLTAISKMYKVDVEDIKSLNNITDDNIKVGQRIAIPQTVVVRQKAGTKVVDEKTHVKQDSQLTNESAATAPRRGHTAAPATVPVTAPSVPVKTTKAQAPAPAPAPAPVPTKAPVKAKAAAQAAVEQHPTTVYKVAAGDTLIKIAKAHDMTVEQLKELNGLDASIARLGQKLKVYDNGAAPAADTKGATAQDRKQALADAKAAAAAAKGARGKAAAAKAEEQEEAQPATNTVAYVVQPGESFNLIAQHAGISTKELLALNPQVKSRTTVWAGEKLNVPAPAEKATAKGKRGKAAAAAKEDEKADSKDAKATKGKGKDQEKEQAADDSKKTLAYHNVGAKDTWASIAKRYGMTVSDLKELNNATGSKPTGNRVKVYLSK